MPKDMFLKRLESYESAEPEMTLGHTTNAGNLYKILNEDVVKPKHDFNGTQTLYFFYGVNFYRQSADFADAISRPVGFLFKNKILKDANSVFPFDTGAFNAKLYGDYLGDDVMEYEVPANQDKTPAKLVKILYESNENYLFGKPKPLNRAKTETEIKLIAFIRGATTEVSPSGNFDDRCYAIEVQFIKEQNFRDNLELLILPRQAYEYDLKGLLEDNLKGLNIDYYDDSGRFGPKEDSAVIKQKALDYLRNNGTIR